MENNAGKDVHPSNGKAVVMDCSIACVGAPVGCDLFDHAIRNTVGWNKAGDCASGDRIAAGLAVEVAILIYLSAQRC